MSGLDSTPDQTTDRHEDYTPSPRSGPRPSPPKSRGGSSGGSSDCSLPDLVALALLIAAALWLLLPRLKGPDPAPGVNTPPIASTPEGKAAPAGAAPAVGVPSSQEALSASLEALRAPDRLHRVRKRPGGGEGEAAAAPGYRRRGEGGARRGPRTLPGSSRRRSGAPRGRSWTIARCRAGAGRAITGARQPAKDASRDTPRTRRLAGAALPPGAGGARGPGGPGDARRAAAPARELAQDGGDEGARGVSANGGAARCARPGGCIEPARCGDALEAIASRSGRRSSPKPARSPRRGMRRGKSPRGREPARRRRRSGSSASPRRRQFSPAPGRRQRSEAALAAERAEAERERLRRKAMTPEVAEYLALLPRPGLQAAEGGPGGLPRLRGDAGSRGPSSSRGSAPSGALDPGMEGLRRLAWAASDWQGDRPKWALRQPPERVERGREGVSSKAAQDLLRELGPTLVEQGRLAP